METLSDDDHAPMARSGHIAAVWRDHMYIWGGYNHEENGSERWFDPKIVWKYDLNNYKWYRYKIQGQFPPQCIGSCCGCLNGKLIVFGGCGARDFNDIWIFQLSNMKWEFPQPEGLKPSERNKTACCTYKDRLVVFGGYGPEPVPGYHFMNGDFDLDDSSFSWDRGWNNDLLSYDMNENKWISFPNGGDRPSSRAAHAMTAIGNKAFVYGGRHLYERLGDLHSLCLDANQWTAIKYKPAPSSPIGRSWHTLIASSKTDLFLFGGVDTARNTLSDAWICNLPTCVWRRAPVKDECRLWHTACRGAVWGEILIFGGCITSIFIDTKHSNRILRFNLQPKSLLRTCLEILALNRKTWSERNDYIPVSLYRKLNKMSGDGG